MRNDDEDADVRSASKLALALEPDLRLLEGIAVILRHLGQGTDPVEPAAIAALATSAYEPIARIAAMRRATSVGQQ